MLERRGKKVIFNLTLTHNDDGDDQSGSFDGGGSAGGVSIRPSGESVGVEDHARSSSSMFSKASEI